MTTESDGDLSRLRDQLRLFVAERDWEQFHSAKNLAMALAAEVGELLAEMQWLDAAESDGARDEGPLRERVSMELADVGIYLLLLTDRVDVDLVKAIEKKLSLNAERYSLDVAQGSRDKRPHCPKPSGSTPSNQPNA